MMAEGPRKKSAFFNKGRGIPEMEEQTAVASCSSESLKGYHSAPATPFDAHCPYSENYNSLPSTSDYYFLSDVFTPREGPPSSSNSSASVTRGLPTFYDFRSQMSSERASAFEETPAYISAKTLQMQHHNSIPSTSGIQSETSQESSRKKKRPQKCRLCANHNIQEDVKGHKWYCPFRNCPCHNCEITKKTQYYMKERQKLTRKQQPPQAVQHPAEIEIEPELSSHSRRQNMPPSTMDFPRREELQEINNIIDESLFEQINEVCRPKSTSKR